MESYSVEAILTATDRGFSQAMNNAIRSMDGVGQQSKQLGNGFEDNARKSNSFTSAIKNIAIGVGAIKLVSSAINMVKGSIGDAISRFDTLNKYPVVMSALGYSTEDVNKSMKKLGSGIDGLPTSLDEIVSSTQQLSIATGSLRKGTDTAVALNDAFLASGASTANASRGMQQYIQMLGKGEVDMQSWRSLQDTMPVAMDKVAKSFKEQGIESVQELYSALKKGDITFKEFNDRLIELDDGVGGFADLARKNSEGIATSWSNIRTAIVKGVANVITALDDMVKAASGKNIAQNFDGLKAIVNATFKVITTVISASTPVVKVFAITVGGLFNVIKPLLPIMSSFAATFVALKVIRTVGSYISNTETFIRAYLVATKLSTLATDEQVRAELAHSVSTKADSILIGAKTALLTAQSAVMNILTGTTTLATVATTALNVAIKLLTGPIGWVTAALGALVAIGVSVYKWLNKETEASKALNKEQDKLANSTNQLTDSIQSNAASRKDNLIDISSSASAYKKMGESVTDLANKENKSAADKKLLKSQIEELNHSMEGLNLSYDEETGKLSMSTEQMQARIAAMQQQEAANTAQSSLTTILKEQADVEAKLGENSALREEWNKKLEDGSVKSKEYKEAIAGLDEQEQTLKDTQTVLQKEYSETQDVLESSLTSVAQATEDGVFRQVISYENLNESQKKAVDNMTSKWQEYSEAATNMFDTLSDKQEMSVAEMQANLEENQRVIGDWGQNIATLTDRGLDEGLLNKLREAGPESAGYVAALVSASDEELAKMSETFKNGGEVATTAFKNAFNSGDLPSEITSMVSSTKQTLADEIKAADFGALGQNISKGTASGVAEGTTAVTDATETMAEDTKTAFTDVMQINSPSRLFKEYGGYITEGLVKGIENGSREVEVAIKSLADTFSQKGNDIANVARDISEAIPDKFINLNSQMESIGLFAMSGLTEGINAGSHPALSAAKNVADQIVNTMQSALDIHSPSRVMRNEVGAMIPAGIAVGIDQNAGLVEKSMQNLSKTIELPALDNLRGNLSVSSFSEMNFNSDFNSNIIIEVPVNIDGKEVARVTAKPMSQELQRLNDKANTALGRRV